VNQEKRGEKEDLDVVEEVLVGVFNGVVKREAELFEQESLSGDEL
jgi:hypothetical protein